MKECDFPTESQCLLTFSTKCKFLLASSLVAVCLHCVVSAMMRCMLQVGHCAATVVRGTRLLERDRTRERGGEGRGERRAERQQAGPDRIAGGGMSIIVGSPLLVLPRVGLALNLRLHECLRRDSDSEFHMRHLLLELREARIQLPKRRHVGHRVVAVGHAALDKVDRFALLAQLRGEVGDLASQSVVRLTG